MASSPKARWVFAAGTTLALCAAGAMAYLAWGPERVGRTNVAGDRPEIRELVAALARETTRPIEGRLSADVPHRPLVPQTRGGRPELSPDVRIAAATVEKRARAAATPANNAALAAAFLAIGDWDSAVDAIQEAIEAEPSNPTFLNDASVVYLARAVHRAFPEDWVRALAAANRSIRIDARRPEPHFNRALALNGLHLTTEEIDAWSAYASVDPSGPWYDESTRRLTSLRQRQRDQSSTDRSRDTQAVRERIEDDLLARWGRAVEQRDAPTADRLLAEADALATQLVEAGGDRMPRDEVTRIRRAHERHNNAQLQRLATGHRLFGEARAAYVQDRQLQASQVMVRAAEYLRRAGSPYWQWAPLYRVVVMRNSGEDYDAGLKVLATVPASQVPREYHYLRGRIAWIEVLLRQSRGRFDLTRDLMTRAVDEFRTSGETDNLAATQTILAEAEWYLGDWDSAWTNLMDVFAVVDRRGTTRRVAHLDLAATLSSAEGLHEAAAEFLTVALRVSNTPRVHAGTYLRRARAYAALKDSDAAASDFKAASKALRSVVDPVLNERIDADINVAQADFYSGVDCERAVEFTNAALPHLTRTRTIWLGRALGIRARCRESMGDVIGAQTDLRAAVDVFESRRAEVPPADRALAFDLERAAFKDLVAFESRHLDDEAAAFATAERGRAGVLAESWGRPMEPFSPASLPADVAVVYYESLPDRVMAWVITREGRQAFSRPISDTALRRITTRLQRVIRLGADLVALRAESAMLFDALIAPALSLADGRSETPKQSVVFIPDGPLFSLPFAALPDAQGRPLLDTRIVSVAPSLTTFLAASTRLASFTPSDVLAVGDGHDKASTGLPMLPRADEEAIQVGKLYARSVVLTGTDATKQRFLAAPAHVIHFAGHAVLNERYPMLSRMLLSPDRTTRDSGWLFANEIVSSRFDRTDVLVLATCQGAAGRLVAGEGPMSLARAFFSAGVPAVVASLWPVDDDVQTLVHTFHRTLLTARDPAVALREGQRALLAERGPRTPVRVWGGFVSLGGRTP